MFCGGFQVLVALRRGDSCWGEAETIENTRSRINSNGTRIGLTSKKLPRLGKGSLGLAMLGRQVILDVPYACKVCTLQDRPYAQTPAEPSVHTDAL